LVLKVGVAYLAPIHLSIFPIISLGGREENWSSSETDEAGGGTSPGFAGRKHAISVPATWI